VPTGDSALEFRFAVGNPVYAKLVSTPGLRARIAVDTAGPVGREILIVAFREGLTGAKRVPVVRRLPPGVCRLASLYGVERAAYFCLRSVVIAAWSPVMDKKDTVPYGGAGRGRMLRSGGIP
jgi:hypothetical protein